MGNLFSSDGSLLYEKISLAFSLYLEGPFIWALDCFRFFKPSLRSDMKINKSLSYFTLFIFLIVLFLVEKKREIETFH